MQASVGDRLHVHNNKVGDPDRIALIVEVRGDQGAPPYLVRFPDGHETLVFPGSDSVIEPSAGAEGGLAGLTRPLEKLAAWTRRR